MSYREFYFLSLRIVSDFAYFLHKIPQKIFLQHTLSPRYPARSLEISSLRLFPLLQLLLFHIFPNTSVDFPIKIPQGYTPCGILISFSCDKAGSICLRLLHIALLPHDLKNNVTGVTLDQHPVLPRTNGNFPFNKRNHDKRRKQRRLDIRQAIVIGLLYRHCKYCPYSVFAKSDACRCSVWRLI